MLKNKKVAEAMPNVQMKECIQKDFSCFLLIIIIFPISRFRFLKRGRLEMASSNLCNVFFFILESLFGSMQNKACKYSDFFKYLSPKWLN